MKNIKELSLKVLIALEVVIGVIILISAFAFESSNEIKKAGAEIQNTIQYIKELCNAGEMRDMASEAKSLMQATESVKQIRNRLDYAADTVNEKNTETLKALAEDNYLDGLMLLDDSGNIKAAYDASGADGEKLLAMISRDELLDTIAFTEKIYTIRLYNDAGGHVDLAAASTGSHDEIIVGYFFTSSEYEDLINNPVKTIVNGFNREGNGFVAVSDDTKVLYANDEALIGKTIESVEILKQIKENGSKTKLAYARSDAKLFGRQFGLMDKSRQYSIYVFMDETDYLPTTMMYVLFIFLLYFSIIVIADILLQRNHLFYEKEKSETKQQYMKVLEEKNRQLEEALNQAQKANLAKTQFLSNMSHDIRTPINGIVGLLKINQDHFDDIDMVKDNYKKMQVAADHLLSLINDVLQMSKIEDGTVVLGHEFINLAELSGEINSILESRVAEHGISLKFEMDKGRSYPCIYGSPVHLREIFLNVYTNCIKYNRPGGTITTEVAVLDETDERCAYQWTITDTGIGMSRDFLKHVFEPFVQEKSDARTVYQGIGLGMSITKSLVELMEGTIRVSSEEGVGTTFVITIPFEIAKERPKLIVSEARSIEGLHLLLAEDNELNAEIAEMLLTDEGAVVTLVTDGRQAVDLFKVKPAGAFDAILMDIMMPVMDGLTAAKAIRALDRPDAKTIPIIAMTANAFTEDMDRCLAAGMNAHLAKPLEMEKVKMTICEQTKRHF